MNETKEKGSQSVGEVDSGERRKDFMKQNTESTHSKPYEQTGHTLGPWSISSDDGSAAAGALPEIIIETDDRHIAFCFGASSFNDQQAVADYKLIAAAPELLEALKEMVRMEGDEAPFFGSDSPFAKAYAQAKAAISKAEGSPVPEE